LPSLFGPQILSKETPDCQLNLVLLIFSIPYSSLTYTLRLMTYNLFIHPLYLYIMKVIAHSIKSLHEARNALKKGANFIEVDVSKRLLLPKFVIQHSAIKGALGIGPILVSVFIPKIREKLFLDIKDHAISLTFAAKLSQLLSAFRVKNVRICGLNWEVISKLCEKNNLLPFYTLKTRRHVEKIRKQLSFLEKPAGFSVHYRLITKEFLEEFKKDQTEIWGWTINDLTTARHLVSLGIDGIITDEWESLLKLR